MEYKVQGLSKRVLQRCVDQLILIDQDTMGERWGRTHFEAELPGKWECSWIVFRESEPTGFVVASVKADSVHVHRIAVGPSVRGRGVGPLLLSRVAECAAERGIPRVTLRVAVENEGAVRFYSRLGFELESSESNLLTLNIPVDILRLACTIQTH